MLSSRAVSPHMAHEKWEMELQGGFPSLFPLSSMPCCMHMVKITIPMDFTPTVHCPRVFAVVQTSREGESGCNFCDKGMDA